MLRCVTCGRRLTRAAAFQPAVETGPTPHPAGSVGPTCARKAGLLAESLAESLFTRRRVAVRRARAKGNGLQLEIAA